MREFGYAVLPDWQPVRKGSIGRALARFVAVGLAWFVVLVLVIEIGWAIHG